MIYAHIQSYPKEEPDQPAEPGMYAREYDGAWQPDYWDGKYWYYGEGKVMAKNQRRPWK